MKKLILALGILFLYSTAEAKTVVIYNTDTKEVYSLSDQDDAVMPIGNYEKVTIKEDIKDLDLIYDHRDYRYQNGTLITNRAKLDDKAAKEEQNRAIADRNKLIESKMREMAIAELIKEGKITEE